MPANTNGLQWLPDLYFFFITFNKFINAYIGPNAIASLPKLELR